MRLVDADEVREKLDGCLIVAHNKEGFYTKDIPSLVRDLKTIDPVRHGKWMKEPREDVIVVCSECHAGCFNKTNYCPLCGAKMDGE